MIHKLITQKESRKLEFKQELPSKDKLIKTAISFSNSQGGDFIIGVDDNNNIVGINKDDIVKFEEIISNTIYDNIVPSIAFIKRNIKLGATIGEVYRQNKWQYPLLALREIIINAIVHRDYSIIGSDIKIAIFDDIIEVTSPEVLPVDKEKLGLGYSEPRNLNLGNLLKKLNIIEQWGTGFSKINKELNEYKDIVLEIEDSSQFTQIKLVQNKTTQETKKLSTKEKIILELKRNAKLTRDDLASLIGVSANAIKQHLSKLKNENKIKRVGSTKAGYWEVLDD